MHTLTEYQWLPSVERRPYALKILMHFKNTTNFRWHNLSHDGLAASDMQIECQNISIWPTVNPKDLSLDQPTSTFPETPFTRLLATKMYGFHQEIKTSLDPHLIQMHLNVQWNYYELPNGQ
jgi:ABC-type uncharacterized transport system YnjBCD substrate-binding protein